MIHETTSRATKRGPAGQNTINTPRQKNNFRKYFPAHCSTKGCTAFQNVPNAASSYSPLSSSSPRTRTSTLPCVPPCVLPTALCGSCDKDTACTTPLDPCPWCFVGTGTPPSHTPRLLMLLRYFHMQVFSSDTTCVVSSTSSTHAAAAERTAGDSVLMRYVLLRYVLLKYVHTWCGCGCVAHTVCYACGNVCVHTTIHTHTHTPCIYTHHACIHTMHTHHIHTMYTLHTLHTPQHTPQCTCKFIHNATHMKVHS